MPHYMPKKWKQLLAEIKFQLSNWESMPTSRSVANFEDVIISAILSKYYWLVFVKFFLKDPTQLAFHVDHSRVLGILLLGVNRPTWAGLTSSVVQRC